MFLTKMIRTVPKLKLQQAKLYKFCNKAQVVAAQIEVHSESVPNAVISYCCTHFL